MKPLISYYGGKQRIATSIVEELNKIPHTVYGEPFCGGAAVLFAKPKPIVSSGDDYREFLNDASDLLINMYRVAIEHREEFELKIQATLYAQSDHRRAIEICKNPAEYDPLTKALAYFVNIQQSFSNKLNSGWGTGAFSRNQAATWESKKRGLSEILDRISEVHICSEDALRCIERWDSPQTLLYIDPPYPGTDQGHYSGYTMEDWEKLCELLDRIQSSYILSNYPQEIEPKTAQRKVEIKAIASSNGRGKVGKDRDKTRKASKEELGDRERTEVLWICDRSDSMRKELGFSRYSQASLFDAAG